MKKNRSSYQMYYGRKRRFSLELTFLTGEVIRMLSEDMFLNNVSNSTYGWYNWRASNRAIYFLSSRLSQDDFINIMRNVPLNLKHNMWLQMDGTPVHFGHSVIRFFIWTLYKPSRRIGRGAAVSWASPDINPLDIFLWEFIRGNSESDNLQKLKEKIRVAFAEMNICICYTGCN